MAKHNDLPAYDEHEQGVDQDIREVAPNSTARNARLARYRGHRSALTEHLNKRNGLGSVFEPKQPETHNRNAVLYLRVSSEEQAKKGGTAEGYSIPYQRDACLAKARSMGLVVVETYVDAGHSAKSANRPQLKRMLAELGSRQVRYVIVHKIDRLARNKRDDFLINEAITAAGAALVSVVDLVDDTPQGKFNYTIQAGLAQLYVDNLAVEVMKGLTKKVETGGTPYRAPVGYLNKRRIEGVADIRWVEVDPDRGPLITWAFEEYATGDWSISRLREALTDKGFTTRTSGKIVGKKVSVNGLHKILTNPYYAGIVPYRGVYYEGDHKALTDMATWLRVQDVLHAHNAAGDKDRTHPHYLKGSIFCGHCGSRLVFSRNKGRGGTYDYFFCMGRRFHRARCMRKGIQVHVIEAGVEDFYQTFQVSPRHAEQIRAAIQDELASHRDHVAAMAALATKRLHTARTEREKFLKAHYAGAVPLDMLGPEMDRLTREISTAEQELAAATTSLTEMEAQLRKALAVASSCAQSYQDARPATRRLMNQGFFTKLFIAQDGSVERAELTEPFAALLTEVSPQHVQTVPDTLPDTDEDRTTPDTDPTATDVLGGPGVAVQTRPHVVMKTILPHHNTPGQAVLTKGVKMTVLAERAGFEPARTEVPPSEPGTR